jgi:RimJ/RimL family protein N-acetyltransferase
MTLAHRITTDRLVLRCWDPADAPLLKEAIDASLDHLRPWMDWALAEPTTVEQKADLLRTFADQFARGEDAIYGIFETAEDRVVGGTGFHPRLREDAREIGYWIRADATGQGLASEATAALTRVGFEVESLRRIEIHCDAANLRSAAIPRKLGYTLADERDGRGHLVFRMERPQYAGSPSTSAAVRAFDGSGVRLL